MSFLRESEQQLLAVNDIRPTARRLIQQLREMPGVRHRVSRLSRRHDPSVAPRSRRCDTFWHPPPTSNSDPVPRQIVCAKRHERRAAQKWSTIPRCTDRCGQWTRSGRAPSAPSPSESPGLKQALTWLMPAAAGSAFIRLHRQPKAQSVVGHTHRRCTQSRRRTLARRTTFSVVVRVGDRLPLLG